MRPALAAGILLVLTGVALAAALPRPSPEFSIDEPGKPPVLLSSFKGKVVVMEFLFIRSQHCQKFARTLDTLYGELGPRGFQPVAVAFDPPTGSSAGAQGVSFMTSYLKLTYPVGYASKQSVDSYLGRGANEILNIPQVVVIDRSGTIRATSGGRAGDPTLEDEVALRALLGKLLEERAPREPDTR
jgi:peroxiredoxin